MKNVVSLLVLILILMHQSVIFAQKNEKSYKFGKIKVTVTHNKTDDCKASFYMYENGQMLDGREFESIADLDNPVGLFVPKEPMIKSFFIIAKHGDGEGITHLLDTSSNIYEIPGGKYFITKSKNFLFSADYSGESPAFIIFDLNRKVNVIEVPNAIGLDRVQFFELKNKVYIKEFYKEKMTNIWSFDETEIKLVKEDSGKIDMNKFMEKKLLPDTKGFETCECNK